MIHLQHQSHLDPRIPNALRHPIPQLRTNPQRDRMPGGQVDFADTLFDGVGQRGVKQGTRPTLVALG